MRAVGTVGAAGGIDQGAAKRLGGYADVKHGSFRRYNTGPLPGSAAICRSREGDDVGGKVIPGDENGAVRPNKRRGADRAPRALGIISARRGKRRAVIYGGRHVDAASGRRAATG